MQSEGRDATLRRLVVDPIRVLRNPDESVPEQRVRIVLKRHVTKIAEMCVVVM